LSWGILILILIQRMQLYFWILLFKFSNDPWTDFVLS